MAALGGVLQLLTVRPLPSPQQKVLRYFPPERGQPMVQGPITLILTSLKVAPTHVERMITLQYRDQSLKRTVIHLQFTSWPELYGTGGSRGGGGGGETGTGMGVLLQLGEGDPAGAPRDP